MLSVATCCCLMLDNIHVQVLSDLTGQDIVAFSPPTTVVPGTNTLTPNKERTPSKINTIPQSRGIGLKPSVSEEPRKVVVPEDPLVRLLSIPRGHCPGGDLRTCILEGCVVNSGEELVDLRAYKACVMACTDRC